MKIYRFLTLIVALVTFGAAPAFAQFSPNTVLTATALNNALAAPNITAGTINGTTTITTSGTVTLTGTNNLGALTNATTQSYVDNSTLLATTQFTKRALLAATATIPMTLSSGTYNFGSAGSGAIFGVTTSGGAIASITSIVAGGTGYQVGDVLTLIGGNGDGLAYVSTVSSGAVTAATVFYGGSGYVGTPQLTGSPLPPGSRTGALTGVLTGNVTIIIPSGTLLAGARRIGFQNNTTGNFSITVKLSNGTGGSTGTGVVLPQGSANNTSLTLYTNGTTDVWPEVSSAPNFIIPGVLTVAGQTVKGDLVATSAAIGGASLAAGACSSTATTVSGAAVGMVAEVTPNTYPGDNFYWRGYVSGVNTVTVTVCSATNSSTPTSSTYNIRVAQ